MPVLRRILRNYKGQGLMGQDLQTWGLGIALLVGLLLRFWNLELKPLWLDETITLLFSLGHDYDSIPREALLPLADLLRILSWKPQSCSAIALAISDQSTHPPLFFCLMHHWLGALKEMGFSLRWQGRSLPALFGVAEIGAMYALNRAAFSRQAGLGAAALMAVSPFAVYLSQEARHYTLPMLIITLSMIPLVRIAQELSAPLLQKPSSGNGLRWVDWMDWGAWAALSSLGFYVHYFCLLVFVAQVAVLLGLILYRRQWQQLTGLGLVLGTVGISLLPWLPFLLGHTQRSETDWLRFNGGGVLDWIGPIARLLAGSIVTVVMLPVEAQPWTITLLNGFVMLAIALGVARLLWTQIPHLWHKPQTQMGTLILGAVLVIIWVEYLILVYGLRKDLTLAPRYGFVFYPMLCGLIGASLTEPIQSVGRSATASWRLWLTWGVLWIGLISTGCVVNDLAFLKPFQPKQVAQQLLQTAGTPLMVLQTYQGTQDLALGLSTALAVQQFTPESSSISIKTVPRAAPRAVPIPQSIQWGFVEAQGRQQIEGRSPAPLVLWQISALRQTKPAESLKSSELDRLDLKTPAQTKMTCAAQKQPSLVMGVAYQPFFCEAKKA